MFAGRYNKTAVIRNPSLWKETEAATAKSGSSKLRKLKNLQEEDKFFGNTGVTGTVKSENKENKDPQIFIREVRDLNNSKYQEYANALRPVTSRIYATRQHNEKHCSEGSLLRIQNSDTEKGKTYKIVETAINETNKELWLYCDRVQNNIEE